jgi:hypothetical protein
VKQSTVLLLMFISVVPAVGKDEWYPVFGPDGNHLIVTCRAALRVIDSGGEKGTGTKQNAYDSGYCQGLVSGVASYINSEDAD